LEGGYNTYAYVSGNPLRRTDRLGLHHDDPESCTGVDLLDCYLGPGGDVLTGGFAAKIGLTTLKAAAKLCLSASSKFHAKQAQKKAIEKTFRYIARTGQGDGLAVSAEMQNMALTASGRTELLAIHRTASSLIPHATSNQAASVIKTVADYAGTLARGGGAIK